MSDYDRIINLSRIAPLSIEFACIAQTRKQAREAFAYMLGIAEAIETCRRTAQAVGGEVEL